MNMSVFQNLIIVKKVSNILSLPLLNFSSVFLSSLANHSVLSVLSLFHSLLSFSPRYPNSVSYLSLIPTGWTGKSAKGIAAMTGENKIMQIKWRLSRCFEVSLWLINLRLDKISLNWIKSAIGVESSYAQAHDYVPKSSNKAKHSIHQESPRVLVVPLCLGSPN